MFVCFSVRSFACSFVFVCWLVCLFDCLFVCLFLSFVCLLGRSRLCCGWLVSVLACSFAYFCCLRVSWFVCVCVLVGLLVGWFVCLFVCFFACWFACLFVFVRWLVC